MTGRAVVLRGDARALPLRDASVDLIVTSPPYYAMRTYIDGGLVYDGQIGSEPTPAEYIGNLVECTREWVRVLKPAGSLWVNLGDAYYSGKGSPGRTTVDAKTEARTGTTALVASVLGRIGVTVDRSADYCRLAAWRTSDSGERARAMRVPKPEEPTQGQEPLFDLAQVVA